MVFALVVIAAIYLGTIALLVVLLIASLRDGERAVTLGSLFFLGGIPFLLWQHYADSASAVLRATRARPESAGDALVPVAERLAAQADVRPPDVVVAHSGMPNALAVPTLGKPLIVVTTELIRRLEPE